MKQNYREEVNSGQHITHKSAGSRIFRHSLVELSFKLSSKERSFEPAYPFGHWFSRPAHHQIMRCRHKQIWRRSN